MGFMVRVWVRRATQSLVFEVSCLVIWTRGERVRIPELRHAEVLHDDSGEIDGGAAVR